MDFNIESRSTQIRWVRRFSHGIHRIHRTFCLGIFSHRLHGLTQIRWVRRFSHGIHRIHRNFCLGIFSHRLHGTHRTTCWGSLPQIARIYTDAANFRGCTCLRSALPLARARSAPTEQKRIACLGDLTTD